MSHESYIVSYFHGTSGSFITHLLWSMINDIDEAIPITHKNSVHPFYSPWNDTWTHPEYNDPECANSKNIFKGLQFKKKGIVMTHTYPDFDLIDKSLPDTKIILITFGPSSFNEIAYNCVTKTDSGKTIDYLESAFNNLYNLKDYSMVDQFYSFCDTSLVPEDLTNKILMLEYTDIYQKTATSYVAIEKLSKLTGKSILPKTLDSYNQYVKTRNEFYGTN